MLPPRERFSPQAVGAVGLIVHRLGAPGDCVIGQRSPQPVFADRHFVTAPDVVWPPFGRVKRYKAGVVAAAKRLRPARIEVHNRADLAMQVARALPASSVALFVHNDPQAMRGARQPGERAALLRAMQVICVSAHLRARFAEALPPDAPAVHVLRNAIDLAALPAALPPDRRARAFLFVGRIVADKGADAFVRAWAAVRSELPDWRAVMIGADRFFPGAPATPFQRALLPLANAAGVEMRGYCDHGEVLRAMAQAAAVVAPSRWAEPFGLVALEAIASGAALICSRRGGLPEVAGDAALYADPDTPGELEAAMRRAADDAGLRARLGAAGRARAAQFDLAASRDRLASLRSG